MMLDQLTPRIAIRELIATIWHSAEIGKHVIRGSNQLRIQELQNKLEAYSLFEHVDHALSLNSSGKLSLPHLIERCTRLDSYSSVWASEGVGHYFAESHFVDNRRPQAIMSKPASLGVSRTRLVPLNAGLGLGLAEWILEKADRKHRIDCQTLSEFVEACRDNCSPGYEEVGFEALGLAAVTLHPHLLSTIDKILSQHYPDILDYFWHGVGRALYFSPIHLFPLCQQPWHGFELCRRIAPHAIGRQNAAAGFMWALTLVNIRHPEIVADFLKREAANALEPKALVNGLCSALLVWRDIQPDERQVNEFVRYQPRLPFTSKLWKTHVEESWARTLRDTGWNERDMGLLFRFQNLVADAINRQ